ncbi:peptidoglycan DD-metalloendopeptidase family protein [Flavobacteriaceae bacterium]|jgi:murein hydrolase activator|nr:peptidoglycan DD-metalloendopeptidase family protein [Flavobacteriaceae bacterium]MDC1492178.1 peptidoglycan DD-metalloendopeptidase family protein [Flavobacteriaceae bacterium]
MLSRLGFILSVILALAFSVDCNSQNLNQKDLEIKRIALSKEIKSIQKLINNSKDEKKLVVENIENLNYKLDLQKDIIKITNNELNIISTSIKNNQSSIDKLLKDQELLKDQYAEMILRSYKTRSKTGKLMFIFSSSNFQQALKRIQYFKQYSDYQNNQLQKISKNKEQLKIMRNKLIHEKNVQLDLISKNQKTKNNISLELNNKNNLLKFISNNETKYSREIKLKQQKTAKIDKEIERIIARAIAESNKKKKTSSKVFTLTPEAKLLSNNFIANKGKFPWPVQKGYVTLKYGKQPHPVVKTATIQSNGIRIITASSQKARSIFNGFVYRIISSKNGSKTILIQHGNFFTVYKNLSNIYVKKGDKVSTKQDLGEIMTNKNSGQTILSFSLFKDNKTENPLFWIGKK